MVPNMLSKEELENLDSTLLSEEPVKKFGCVIVGDNFSKTFTPPLLDDPWVGQKLCGLPLIDFILISLARTPVTNVVVMSSNFPNKWKEYYSKKYYNHFWKINFVEQKTANCVGDILREVRQRNLLNMDFILIPNILTLISGDFKKEISEFEEGRIKNHNHLITCLYVQSHDSQNLFVINSENAKIVNFHTDVKSRKTKIKKNAFTENLQYCSNLKPLPLWICGKEVFDVFGENFDLTDIEDVMRHILANEEVMCVYTCMRQVSGNSYAAEANDFIEWIGLQSKFLRSCFYPLKPIQVAVDNNPNVNLLQLYHSVYIGHNRKDLNFRSKGVTTSNSRRSYIGWVPNKSADLQLEIIDSSIAGAVNLVKGSSFKHCKNCKIGKEVFIGNDVTIPDNQEIHDNAMIFSKPVEHDDNRFISTKNGNYYIWKTTKDVHLWQKNKEAFNFKCIVKDIFTNFDENKNSDDEVDNTDHIGDSSIKTEQNCLETFAIEVKDSMLATLQSSNPFDKGNISSLILEINSSKMVHNVHMDGVCLTVMTTLLQIEENMTWKRLNELLTGWKPIIKNYFNDHHSIKLILVAIEDIVKNNDTLSKLMVKVIHMLYNEDILSEMVVIEWYEKLAEDHRLKADSKVLYEWLCQDTEDDSDE
ncbi:Translation initiation factor eIF-2B subunit epsilon [Strongyloides ratti]|uniref:Translation initiation factor eIF2B subunit epsilon n=1 Tax=Strongyloides ratti TaxID=34506 RepID=A0A090L8W9_STRRB|nr:Translation initiation factor eIF-2B subunit epsilon [Strongyloides ratti]CEF63965.1 Translation initiation factor eIF-2B subunit epsilon [Strongyloides ratti]